MEGMVSIPMITRNMKEGGELFARSSRAMMQKIDRLKKERDSLKKLCRDQQETVRRYRVLISMTRRYGCSTEPW